MEEGRSPASANPLDERLTWVAIGVSALLAACHVDAVRLVSGLSVGSWSAPLHALLVAAVLLGVARARSLHLRLDRMSDTVTSLQAAEAGALGSANVDALTGLPNRRAIREQIDAAVGEMWSGLGVAVLLIDLDGFKAVNDVHGHECGDKVLCAVAERLRAALSFGTCLARLGGDEFAVLVPYSLQHRAEAEAQAAVNALRRDFRVGDLVVQLGASVGVARAPEDSNDAGSLLRAADIAMYRAKQAGGGCVQPFHASMEQDLRERTALKAELRQAIAFGQIVPFYQPIVDLENGRIIEFEVLARWQHPRQGCLAPGRFIDLVVETGQATPMLLSLLRQVATDAAMWPSGIRFAVNIFPSQLHDVILIDAVEAVAEAGGLRASRLCLEVTEEALVKDPGRARAAIDAAHRHGMTVALDDFGTGFSSLYHLRELPFDRLKIDRSFLERIATDERSVRTVEAIVAFSRSLGLEVVAEGIETGFAAELLASLRCTFGQGYHFARPVPACDVSRLLEPTVTTVREVELAD